MTVAPKRILGTLITVNETIIDGVTLPAEHWTSWGQTDITPFIDNVTTMGDLD